MKTAIKEKFEKKSLILMLDVKSMQTQISNLRCNIINVSVYINLIKTLLKMFKSDKIAIISSYWVQQKVYYHTLYKLQFILIEKNLQLFQNKIINSFQENETDIIILNLVITDKLRFMCEMNWFNIELIWAQDSLMIITDININESNSNKRFVHWMIRLISVFKQSKLILYVKVLNNLNISMSLNNEYKKIQEEDINISQSDTIMLNSSVSNTADVAISSADNCNNTADVTIFSVSDWNNTISVAIFSVNK